MPNAYVYAIDERAPICSWRLARQGDRPWLINTISQSVGMRDICRLICRRLRDSGHNILILRIAAHGTPNAVNFGRNFTLHSIRENFGMIRRFWATNGHRIHPDVCVELHVCYFGASPAGGILQELANQAGVPVKTSPDTQIADSGWRFEGTVRTINPLLCGVGYPETTNDFYAPDRSFQTPSVLHRRTYSSVSLRRPVGLSSDVNFAGAYITHARIHQTLDLQGIPQCSFPRSDPRHHDYQP